MELKCNWCGETKAELEKDMEVDGNVYVNEISFFNCLTVDDTVVDRGIVCNNCIAAWMIEDPKIDIIQLRKLEA